MKNEIKTLQCYFCPYGYLDVRAVCQVGDELGLTEDELFDIIDEDRESLGYENADRIDPVASVLDHILQLARSAIEATTGYDFMNDFEGAGSEIYTYSNYMSSSYDYGEDALEELSNKVSPYYQELVENKWCHYLFKQLEIKGK